MFHGRGDQLRRAVKYLNPSLSTGTRLFRELSRDEPLLERFLVDSAQFVGALAERATIRSLVSNANTTFRARNNQQALAESIELLPPFMRRANTTFVNLRTALDDVDPLVEVSKPAVRRLALRRGARVRRRRRADDSRPPDNDPPPWPLERPDRADPQPRRSPALHSTGGA